MKNIHLIGVSLDKNSSYLRGPAGAPQKIREILFSDMMNSAAENGAELGRDISLVDRGDLLFTEDSSGGTDFAAIRDEVKHSLEEGGIPLLLGGDHSITYPAVSAIHEVHGRINILHIDAHPDLYQDYNGNRFSHASPFARIMEDGLVTKLVQVGVRTLNRVQRKQVKRFAVEIVPMADFSPKKVVLPPGPLYISIDLDGLDPACAPGVSHHEPGGLLVRQLLDILQNIDNEIVGCDIVEYNPKRDINDMTGAVAVKLLKELAALASRNWREYA